MKKIVCTMGFIVVFAGMACSQPRVNIELKPEEKRVDVRVGSDLFTSYIYPGNIEKPVLWPVMADGQLEVTRQFPLGVKAGERTDHPHHVGVWFNYGDVNGLDFWNNSEAIPAEKAEMYGTIFHETVELAESGKGVGRLTTTSSWKDSKGKTLLGETTEFTFRVQGKTRIIDRTATLKAVNGDVRITDNKEGMFAIRVARELEMPTNEKLQLTDAHGQVTTVDASTDKTPSGSYLSSEGITDDAVWSTRGRWMKLSGVINGQPVALVIFDHPANAGYPTYWHARGYGLFSANSLGLKVFSNGKEEMNFMIDNGNSATFRYRLAVFPGNPAVEEIEKMAQEFGNTI
ncbi:MAG: PmoA family protein [Mariniphaga sp.]|nr:PmoA family protein [Mariniphaga sp.]